MTTLLDGGLATELEARGHDLSDRLWSARLLLTDPGAIGDVHLAYFRAGARVATTASYQATIPGFEAAGLDRTAALDAIRRSVEVAREARDRFAAETDVAVDADAIAIAGSVGPYGAMLADGSEYRGEYDPGEGALRDLHASRMEALLEAGADLLALETIPTTREAAVLLDLLDELGARGWLTYQCRDGAATAAGEPIEEAAAIADGRRGLVGLGVNCTAPRHVPSLLARLARCSTPRIAYPNGGDRWDAEARRWVASDPAGGFAASTVAGWARLPDGPAWVGGCCGTGPSDIAALAEQLDAARPDDGPASDGPDRSEPAGRVPAGS